MASQHRIGLGVSQKGTAGERGIELMRNAMAAAEGSAERNRRTLYLGHLASAHASLGQPEVGLDLLDEAVRTAEVTSEMLAAGSAPTLNTIGTLVVAAIAAKAGGTPAATITATRI